MKLVVGSDHAGFRLKEQLKELARSLGHEVLDVGTHSTESTDYPDWGTAVGTKVVEMEGAGEGVRGLCVCGSGIGISIAANKVPGVRAALVTDATAARLARQHNDANVLCLGERLVGGAVAEDALRAFLETGFEGGRHARRVDKLKALDRAPK
jgi:ribose 5-phosphate isomerase B